MSLCCFRTLKGWTNSEHTMKEQTVNFFTIVIAMHFNAIEKVSCRGANPLFDEFEQEWEFKMGKLKQLQFSCGNTSIGKALGVQHKYVCSKGSTLI